MSKNELKSLGSLVSTQGSSLHQLAERAEERLELCDALRAALPAELREALRGANLRDDGTLVVLASGPAWAARLRFEATTLLECCRARHPAVSRVRVRVAHAGSAAPPG